MKELEFFEKLTYGLSQLSLEASLEQKQSLFYYLLQLQQWNKTYNLTAIQDPMEIMVKHFFDSLSIFPYLKGNEVLDVGSGAGFPGMVLALFDKQRHYTLLDSNGKKTRFLTYLQSYWKLPNVRIINNRLEDFQERKRYSSILSRAFSNIDSFVAMAKDFCENEGYLLAMKGKIIEKELNNLNPKELECTTIPLSVPYLTAQRHLVMIKIL